jgi:hypothetical protein
VEETLKGNTVRLLSQRRKENLPLDLPVIFLKFIFNVILFRKCDATGLLKFWQSIPGV